ncbi:cytochrome c, partial [Paraburkholderia sp. RL17-347-BIC-D]
MTKKTDIQRLMRAMKRVGAAAVLGMTTLAAHAAAPQNQNDAALIAHGQYLARAGDCIACHSAPAGKPFA